MLRWFLVRLIDRARTGLNYSEFAVVMESGAFDTTESVKGIVRELSLRYLFGLFGPVDACHFCRFDFVSDAQGLPTSM